MIYDHRTYTCRPNTLKKQMKLYEEHGWDAQRRHLGDPVVYGAVETGDVNSYIHIWVYKDAADRAARRKAMSEDPEWIAYLQKALRRAISSAKSTRSSRLPRSSPRKPPADVAVPGCWNTGLSCAD